MTATTASNHSLIRADAAAQARTAAVRAGALVGSIAGSIAIFAVAGLLLLTVPVAAAIVFLPPLLDAL